MLIPEKKIVFNTLSAVSFIDPEFQDKGRTDIIHINSIDKFMRRFGSYARIPTNKYNNDALELRTKLRRLYLAEKLNLESAAAAIEDLFADPDEVPETSPNAAELKILLAEPECWNGIKLLKLYDRIFYRVHMATSLDAWKYPDSGLKMLDGSEPPEQPLKKAHQLRATSATCIRRYCSEVWNKCHTFYKERGFDNREDRLKRRQRNNQQSVSESAPDKKTNGDAPPTPEQDHQLPPESEHEALPESAPEQKTPFKHRPIPPT